MNIVYFLQRANGDIKIGTSRNYKMRLSNLISKHGDLTLLGVMTGNRDIEKQLHTYFSTYRVGRSEFFKPNEDLLKFIKENTHLELEPIKQVQAELSTANRVTQVRFPDDFFEALEQERQKQHKPASFIIREALAEYLNKRGHKVEPEMNWGGKRDKEQS